MGLLTVITIFDSVHAITVDTFSLLNNGHPTTVSRRTSYEMKTGAK